MDMATPCALGDASGTVDALPPSPAPEHAHAAGPIIAPSNDDANVESLVLSNLTLDPAVGGPIHAGQRRSKTSKPAKAKGEPRKPDPPEPAVIKRQIEYYFSDENIFSDPFMLHQVEQDPEGYVSLAVIMSFDKLKRFGTDPRPAAEALAESETLEVSLDGQRVRRRIPTPPNALQDLQRRVLLITQLPNITKEGVVDLCRPFGELGFVRLRSGGTRDSMLEGLSFTDRWIGRKQYALIEFRNPEHAAAAKNAIDDTTRWGGMRAATLQILKPSKPKTRAPSKQPARQGRPGAAQLPPDATADGVDGVHASTPPAPRVKKDYRTWASASGASSAGQLPKGPRQPTPGEKGFAMGRGAGANLRLPLAPGSE